MLEGRGTGDGDAPSGCDPVTIAHVSPKDPVAPEMPSTATVSVPAAGYMTRMCEARKASTKGEVRMAAGQGVGVGFTPQLTKPKATEQPFPVPA